VIDIDEDLIRRLKTIARKLRCDVIRMTGTAKSGHPGGSLSAADIITALYFHQMRIDPQRPDWEDRDRFVLSKGHSAPALYAALAEAGYFPKEELLTLRKLHSILQGHPDMKKTPGVDMTTGSLGQGLSVANGMALAGKLDEKDYHVYAMIGDGESDEGQIWEAAMAAAHYKLDNLTAILDYNGLQIDGPVEEIMSTSPMADKWRAFNWNVIEIDGHNFRGILTALALALEYRGKPTIIIAHTIKGKGVSFMENVVDFHGKAPTQEQMEAALCELET